MPGPILDGTLHETAFSLFDPHSMIFQSCQHFSKVAKVFSVVKSCHKDVIYGADHVWDILKNGGHCLQGLTRCRRCIDRGRGACCAEVGGGEEDLRAYNNYIYHRWNHMCTIHYNCSILGQMCRSSSLMKYYDICISACNW